MTSSVFNWITPGQHEAILWYCFDTPAGMLKLSLQGKILCNTAWATRLNFEPKLDPLPVQFQQRCLDIWLSSTPQISLPLLAQGTSFQRTVWNALRMIPIGQTRTYGELAKQLKTSPRALANACRNNPFPLIIPCHRVVAKTGIGGYAGEVTGKLIEVKTALLDYEKMIAHDL